ncbi:MAG TPA: hypothetical protein VI795_00355 [Patescibacteria group bacterium]|nr:hypothetical protein [Patescibacteria group bacterium]
MPPATFDNLIVVFTSVVLSLMSLGGITLFILIFTSGFKYLTSGGDPKALEAAKKTLTYAIGGFVLFIFSYLILKIIGTITGVETNVLHLITNFQIVR